MLVLTQNNDIVLALHRNGEIEKHMVSLACLYLFSLDMRNIKFSFKQPLAYSCLKIFIVRTKLAFLLAC